MIRFKSLSLKYIVLLAFFSLGFYNIIEAQTTTKNQSDFWQNVQFGGGIGLGFGNGFFSGSVAPVAIYNFNPYVSAGVGLNASYSSERNVFSSTVLGGSAIGLFNPYPEIQLSTEFEQLYVNRDFDENFVTNLDDSYWYPALFLGVGYRSGNVIFGVRYDVLYDNERSIQPQAWMPFVRFWF